MATVIRRGQDYIINVNMGYDYNSNKIKPVQKVITPPKNLKDLDLRDWLDEQIENFESEVKQRQTQAITLTEFTENWIADTVRVAHDRYCTDLKQILPQLGSYDLKTESSRNRKQLNHQKTTHRNKLKNGLMSKLFYSREM